jgi:hypothetical protein
VIELLALKRQRFPFTEVSHCKQLPKMCIRFKILLQVLWKGNIAVESMRKKLVDTQTQKV